jgi:hypothetical protein
MKDKRDMKGGGNASLRIQIAINVRQGEPHVGEGVEEVLKPAREVVEDELAEGFGFLCVLSTWCFSVLLSQVERRRAETGRGRWRERWEVSEREGKARVESEREGKGKEEEGDEGERWG